jgi:hypothetical protein
MAKHETEEAAQVKPSREAMRAKLFSEESKQVKKVPIIYNGVELEWRQPTVQQAQDAQELEGRNFMVMLLIGYSYVPGTDERVFDESDYDDLVNMPLNSSFQAAVRQISETLDLKVDDKVKN